MLCINLYCNAKGEVRFVDYGYLSCQVGCLFCCNTNYFDFIFSKKNHFAGNAVPIINSVKVYQSKDLQSQGYLMFHYFCVYIFLDSNNS